MSAGSGIFHSEFNYGTTPVHLYQIWIEPIKENLTPSYEQKHFDLDTTKNQLVKLLSPEGKECLAINSDSMLYFGSFDPDKHYTYTTGPNRKVFIYLSEGEMRINHELFSAKDQARIDGESELELQMMESSKFILIDTPA